MKKIFTLLFSLVFSATISLWAGDLFYYSNATVSGTEAEYTSGAVISSQSGKDHAKGGDLTIDGKKRTSFKVSAGKTFTFKAPAGRKVSKLTVYTTCNYAKDDTKPTYVDYIGTQAFGAENGLFTSYKANTSPQSFVAEFDTPLSSVEMKFQGQQVLVVLEVEYSSVIVEQLPAPTISFDNSSLAVTISASENAAKICYTTDGSIPNENSKIYDAPFTVADGTNVRAIAVGDDDNWRTSEVASKRILLASGTIATPIVNEYNGAFSISCVTPGVKIQYSTDGGTTWKDYGLPVTVFVNTEIIAKATRDGWVTAQTEKITITVPEYIEDHHHVIIGGGSYTISGNDDGGYDATGTWGDASRAWGLNLSVDKGYTLTSGDNNHKIKIYGRPVDYDDNTTRKVIMTEENAEITMSIPDGVSVTRIFFYTVIHEDEVPENCHWEVLYGDKWMSSAEVPEESTDVNDPAVRVFTFDKVSDHITFRHVGCAPHFCLAVNIVYDDIDTAEHNMGGDVNGIGTKGAPVSIELSTQYSHHEIYYKFENFATYAVSRADNVDHTGYTKLERTNGKHILTIPADTSGALTYYSFDPYTNVKSEENTMTFDAATTGIDDVVVDGNDAPVEYFNLQGQRVANPVSGNLYIVRQGNTVRKLVL